MKYLISQLILSVVSVTILYYLFGLDYFRPYERSGELNWYNISIFLGILAILLQAVISTIVYLIQKFLAFGLKEFPDKGFSLKIGLLLTFVIIGIMIFNVLGWGSLVWIVILMAVIILLIFTVIL
jgi:hypothetical protein